MIMFKHFSYDIDQETKKEYLKNYPIIKKDDHGLLMRRTYLYVLKQRKEVDGHEECAGYSCECGYSYVLRTPWLEFGWFHHLWCVSTV